MSQGPLISDLEQKEPSALRDAILARARIGYYHDFMSPVPFPKITLREDLLRAGWRDLANRVVQGDYDDDYTP